MANLNEVDALSRIFQFMIKKSEKCWDKKRDISGADLCNEAKENFKSLSKWMVPLKGNKLDSDIKKAHDTKKSIVANNIYFPPLCGRDDKNFVPILSFEADFSKQIPKISFRVGLLTINKDNSKLKVFGCRFEVHPPESDHNFYHGQFTRDPLNLAEKFDDLNYLEMIGEGFPEHIPCLLAPAKESVSLLVCIIIDLYGKKSIPLLTSMSFIPGIYKTPLGYMPKQ